MWPLDPATILLRWENGLSLPGGPLVVVSWDASPLSVGLSIWTRPDQIWRTAGMHYEQATSIVTFSGPVEAQVHRESAGAPISFRIFEQPYESLWVAYPFRQQLPSSISSSQERIAFCSTPGGRRNSGPWCTRSRSQDHVLVHPRDRNDRCGH